MHWLAMSLVLATHLLLMNVAAGAPLVCAWLALRSQQRGDQETRRVGRRLVGWSLAALAGGAALGGAVLLLEGPSAAFWTAADQIPHSRYWFGAVELLFYIVCLVPPLIWFGPRARQTRVRAWTSAVLLLVAALNLLYHFPTLFSVIGSLAVRPERWDGGLSFVDLMLEPEPLSLAVHFALASFTAAGLALAVAAGSASHEMDEAARLSSIGGWMALAATGLQLPCGLLVLSYVRPSMREALLGSDPWATGVFVAALLLVLGLLHHLANIALGARARSAKVMAAVFFALTVAAMTGAQQRARAEIGGNASSQSAPAESPHWLQG